MVLTRVCLLVLGLALTPAQCGWPRDGREGDGAVANVLALLDLDVTGVRAVEAGDVQVNSRTIVVGREEGRGGGVLGIQERVLVPALGEIVRKNRA